MSGKTKTWTILVLVFCGVFGLTVGRQYVPQSKKVTDINDKVESFLLKCPSGKDFQFVLCARNVESAVEGRMIFKGELTISNATATTVHFDSENSRRWAWVDSRDRRGGILLNWPLSNGVLNSESLQPDHSYRVTLKFEKLPPDPQELWLVWKRRVLSH